MPNPPECTRTRALFGCLSSDPKLMTSLLEENGWGERNEAKEDGHKVTLPIEWVVDIADKDGDWFIGTATGYNDAKQTLHVMVPDSDAPTWTGDVPVNPMVRSQSTPVGVCTLLGPQQLFIPQSFIKDHETGTFVLVANHRTNCSAVRSSSSYLSDRLSCYM